MYIVIHVKYPLFLSDLDLTWIFSTKFEKYSYQISWKSIQWEPSCSVRTDRHMTKLIVAFSNFVNRCKIAPVWPMCSWALTYSVLSRSCLKKCCVRFPSCSSARLMSLDLHSSMARNYIVDIVVPYSCIAFMLSVGSRSELCRRPVAGMSEINRVDDFSRKMAQKKIFV
jgi:hypothetical protein